ncbi:hypothetical protein Pst134EA_022700 [Puccinia striiformis f. sp. tritici]|uniref:hypothetical protein n=1 Tax=Puccinia striiformis f. sp. tritici TaxID=168172 RepID=UPI0020084B79|nr:hypothetical protein Pst134EA_022700 [Puccinia striiformis f. sp. tritici]KAH9455229.1 hypothetical protein Pst134EA_022700 [Puccinia striiformis f. sp. tritici]
MANSPPTLLKILTISTDQDRNMNPYIGLIRTLKEKQNPPVDDSQSRGLLITVVAYNFIFLVCVAIICLPYLQGVDGHKRRHWIIKRQFLDAHRQPYWILNSGLIVAVSHILGSTIFLVYLGLRYQAFQSGYASESFYGSAWLELRWFPSYCSFFTQAWSTWFVRASEASLKGKKSWIHPIAFNLNLIGLPMTALVLALILISAQVSSMSAQHESFRVLISSLTLCSLQWQQGQKLSDFALFNSTSVHFNEYALKSTLLIHRFRTTGLFWTFMAVPTFIFYVFGISTLLRVMYKRFQAVQDQSEEHSSSGKPQSPTWSSSSFGKRFLANHRKNKSNHLRTSFIYLGVHYVMMSATLLYHIITGLIFYFSNDEAMTNKHWLELFMGLSNSGSYFLLAALVVQLLRIISEGRERSHAVTAKTRTEKTPSEYEDSSTLEIKKDLPDIKLMT